MKKQVCLWIIGILLWIPFQFVEAQQHGRVKKEIAIQLYSVRDLINGVNQQGKASEVYLQTLKKLADMGYTAIEAAYYGEGKFYGRTPSDFKRDIEGAGMKVLSSHCSRALNAEELKSGDLSEALAWWDQCIADHREAGMSYIIFPYLEVPKTVKDLELYCTYFNEIGKRCQAAGLSFGYHNHAHEFQKVEGREVMMDYLLQHTDPRYVCFEMDVYWVVRGQQSPVDYFHKYPGRFKMLHLKDHREIGQSGMVGYDAIFRNADVAGVKHIVAEIESYSTSDVLKSVRESIDYLLDAPFIKPAY